MASFRLSADTHVRHVGPCDSSWPALGNGLTLAVMIYMTAKVSGGKLNPAVSLGLLVSGSISAHARKLVSHVCVASVSDMHIPSQPRCAA